ncbi:MAG TPA: hypothetical protein VFG69_20210 [Nannocystaceae bacterium]|nr:hypothetical protein [Nannocystaceae bacterium]
MGMAKVGTLSRAIAGLALWCTACGDDASAVGGSSEEDGSSSADDGVDTGSTGADGVDGSTDDGTDDATATTTGTDPDTTGGTGEPAEDLRVFYELATDPEAPVLAFVDLVDGVASEPLEIASYTGDRGFSLEADRWIVVRDDAAPELTLHDVHSPPPFTSWPLDVPGDTTFQQVVATIDGGSTWLLAASDGSVGDLYVVDVGNEGPSEPWNVNGDLDTIALGGDPAFVLDDQQVAFRASDDVAGTASIWLGPAHDAAPGPVLIEEVPDAALYGPSANEDGTALVYLVGGSNLAPESAHYVDLAAEPVGAPVVLGMLPGMTSVRFTRFAPDGSGVAFTQESDVAGDLAWIAIVDGIPASPVQVSTGESAGLVAFDSVWSPDSRWLTFVVVETYARFVVRFDAGVPGVATRITDPGEGSGNAAFFSPDSQFMYVATSTDASEGRVLRVALDGDVPGAAETLSGPLVGVQQLVLAEDGRSLYYSGREGSDDPAHAWWVDLSGDVPAAPARVDSGLAPDEQVFAGLLTPSGSYALYTVQLEDPDGQRKVVVDLSTGVETSLADGALIGFTALRSLR